MTDETPYNKRELDNKFETITDALDRIENHIHNLRTDCQLAIRGNESNASKIEIIDTKLKTTVGIGKLILGLLTIIVSMGLYSFFRELNFIDYQIRDLVQKVDTLQNSTFQITE